MGSALKIAQHWGNILILGKRPTSWAQPRGKA